MKGEPKVRPLRLSEALEGALRLHNSGNLQKAARLYKVILVTIPDQFDALHLLGVLRAQQGSLSEAERLLRAAVKSDPTSFEALSNLGNALQALDRRVDAAEAYRRALAINPRFAEAHYNLGIALAALDRHDEAIASYKAALELTPNKPEAFCNLGLSLQSTGRFEEAINAISRALHLRPDYPEALNNMGSARLALHDPTEAADACRKALSLRPGFPEAYNNLGLALTELGQWDEALASFEHAIELKPAYFAPRTNLMTLLAELKRFDEAVRQGELANRIRRDQPQVLAALLNSKRRACDWRGLSALETAVLAKAEAVGYALDPFMMLYTVDDPKLHQKCARKRSERVGGVSRFPAPPARSNGRIRLAYLSPDFRAHAMTYVMLNAFRIHDRGAFEVLGISYGPDDGSEFRRQVAEAFDQFHDLRTRSDADVAHLIRDLDVDIAVDLGGHTQFARPGILAHRPARIQVQYLGYPGTLGASHIDYAMVDPFVVPVARQSTFDEQLAYIETCYYISSYEEMRRSALVARSDHGLPEQGIVFCCFCNSFKISPQVFSIWMRILEQVPNSVLWLLSDAKSIEDNVRGAAKALGIDPARLVFARRLPFQEHLSRQALADIFLDTFPYGAHTTACDALWAGVPIITRAGLSFASRVAGSILHDVGVPELIANDFEAYEELAIRLARDAEMREAVRAKIGARRGDAPVFNTAKRVSQMERAFQIMLETWSAGRAPETFHVPAGA